MEEYRISVRDLIEFILRSGDIDNRRKAGVGADAMQIGSKLHRQVQKGMGTSYQAEVTLRKTFEFEEYSLIVEGRADGIIHEDERVIIDEIKGVYFDLEKMAQPKFIHLAQAMCYGAIYGKQEELATIGIQMTYIHMETEFIRRFELDKTVEELDRWFLEVVLQYRKWIESQRKWERISIASIKELTFPFPYREGQAQLVKDVYRTILREKNLFIQAPTGVGKTISTVFPAVKAVGEGLAKKIFYLTAKTITRTVAQEAFQTLKENGYRGKVITLTAKEKICPLDEMSCNPIDCPRAKGHFDRVNEAVYEMITQEESYSREKIETYASKFNVCPFEMGLDVSRWADVIICDYNYVFDPNVYLKRFFDEGVKGSYLFLIDEAHNLVPRARNMYSARLYKDQFLKIRKLIEGRSGKLGKSLMRCNKIMLEYKRECSDCRVYENISGLYFALLQLATEIDVFLEANPDFDGNEEWSEFYLDLRHFRNMYEDMDEDYVIYGEHDYGGRFKVTLYCVDTARLLEARLSKGVSTIFFSATLLPIQYYKQLLSPSPDNYAVYADSTFDPKNRLLLVARDVSSKYTRRNETEYQRIGEYIKKTVMGKPGNYMVFFPSYRFMDSVGKYIDLWLDEEKDECSQKKPIFIRQESRMNEIERENFMEAFNQPKENSVVGLCVIGGIFAEGIDLKAESLIGAIVVGTGMPQISNKLEILKNYYNKKGEDGFSYAFRFPGLNKVEQAAGRVIRTVDDKGIILLLDERFLYKDYIQYFPREWADYKTCTLDQVDDEISRFWNQI